MHTKGKIDLELARALFVTAIVTFTQFHPKKEPQSSVALFSSI
jgi:hypothetical protein